MGKVFLLCAIILPFVSVAQHVEVTHDKAGLPSQNNVYKRNIPGSDSIQKKEQETLILYNGIIKKAEAVEKVYSEKQWKLWRDSLTKIPDSNIPPIPKTLPAKKEVSEQELAHAVREAFFNNSDSLSGKYTARDSLDGLTQRLPNAGIVDKNLTRTPDLSEVKLPASALQRLSPLEGRTLKSKYLTSLDSIRKVNLKGEHLQLKEQATSAQGKLSLFRKKPSFLDRSYFEGVLGVSGGDFTILQLSPSLGYHFTDYLSFGLGPNLVLREETKKMVTTVGVKTFIKAEFFKRQAYLQAEDVMDSYAVYGSREKRNLFEQHNVFVGAGYLISISSPLTFNLAVLYKVNDTAFSLHEFSPWVFRIGISTIKIKD
ncbi:hypothetical protein KK062_11090 [Fulvivirgaceae bacterium PWU5]|uniref:Outer membrane protein beta-barrel domain-containing protein n=1 Tax=Dawidia cretensis TaxID=2782350 RepID=A0AAP2DYI6_9BACT|nr:hypothetical protein [Dawidia cretensis]MBT1708774.1 hypothetical protein [Dawidia cretensis]